MNTKTEAIKKIIALFLCLVMISGTATTAFAIDNDNPQMSDEANAQEAESLLRKAKEALLNEHYKGFYEFFSNSINPNSLEFVQNMRNDRDSAKLNWLLNYLNEDMNNYFKKLMKNDNVELLNSSAKDSRISPEEFQNMLKAYDENSFRAFFSTAAGVVRGISTVLSLINGTVSLLKTLGVIKNEENEKIKDIASNIKSIRISVDEIDRKMDSIQEMLVDEFADLDLKFDQQNYNHYKDDVWAKFYTDAVIPLDEYQEQYTNSVNSLLIDYIEQWQYEESETDLRALFGKNEETGETVQVFSGTNIGNAGKALGRAPEVSVDNIEVDYSITLPSEYIIADFDRKTVVTVDNCIDKLTEAIEKGVYSAAENGELSAYDGFYTEWDSLDEEEKRQTAEDITKDLVDALLFTCSYKAANERHFASDVKTAYMTFSSWLMGENSLTSPLYAQLKMLSLTHGFEGEISFSAEEIAYYICLMNLNFASFTQTVISMSKAHDEEDSKSIRNNYMLAETMMSYQYGRFITGNPNYCYQLGKNIEYKNTSVTSDLSFVYSTYYNQNNDRLADYEDYCTSNSWVLSEKDVTYSADKTVALSQKAASGEDLRKRSISAKEAKLIYTMYQSSDIKGTFADYLAENKVTLDAEKVSDQLITSFNEGKFDLNSGLKMKYYDVVSLNGKSFENGNMYAVNTDTSEKCENKYFGVYDCATGGLFNMENGTFDENACLASRAFYGESSTLYVDEMYLFSSTNTAYNTVKLSKSEVGSRGISYDSNREDYFDVTADFNADYGMIVCAEQNTYTFPASTESVSDYYFLRNVSFDKIVFDGTPDKIGDNAFDGVGSPERRFLLQAPFATDSLIDKWHGGYFGNTTVTLVKNDGSDVKETLVAVKSAPISTVLNPFSEPENAVFKGWSKYADGSVEKETEIVLPEMTLYAVWEYDHEHDFEVTKRAVAATCTADGSTEEMTCKICGYRQQQTVPAIGHTCTFTLQSNGNYAAECTCCGYSATLYPKTFSNQTVWSESQDGKGVEYYSSRVDGENVRINESGVYVIKTANPGYALDQDKIQIADGITVTVGLAGVDLGAARNGYAPFNIGKSTAHITLIDGADNRIGCAYESAIKSNGSICIDGNGSLYAFSTDYSVIDSKGGNVVINSGSITLSSGDMFGIAVNSESTGGKLIIEENASVIANGGTDIIPVNANGEKVYPVSFTNEGHYSIYVDGRELPSCVTSPEGKVCIYLTTEDHEIKLGFFDVPYEQITEADCYEKQYGDFTVINPALDMTAVAYDEGVLSVKKSTPVTIKNTNPSVTTSDRIYIPLGVDANITLDGVSVNSENAPVEIAENSAADVNITLADGSENILTAGSGMAAITKNGRNGTLTIDGTGSLSAFGGADAAAIGSQPDKPVSGIVISAGNIEAYASSEGAAAIGAGRNDIPDGGSKYYLAQNIVINGGTVRATSENGIAIGADYSGTSADGEFYVSNIIINDGSVIARSNSSDYVIGGGEKVKGEKIRINGGVITVLKGDSPVGMTGAGFVTDGLVIEPMASYKGDFTEIAVNSARRMVKLNVIPVIEGQDINVDGKLFPYRSHNGEDNVYIYLQDNLTQYEEKKEIKCVPHISVEKSERGTVSFSPEAPAAGDKVTLSAEANEGYVFRNFEISPSVEITDDTFIMPETPITIRGVFVRATGKINVGSSTNGKVTLSKTSAAAGDKIKIRVVPDEGMKFESISIVPTDVEIINNSFIMPDTDVEISCVCVPADYTVTWSDKGNTTKDTVPFGSNIPQPKDPEKEGYVFTGWTPSVPETMPASDIEFTAVFSPITYNARFIADEKTVADVPCNLEKGLLSDEPTVPEKIGYDGAWEDYTVGIGGITVKAVYTPKTYIIRFAADGKLVAEVPYTIETLSVTEPDVPEKEGYTGAWSEYSLSIGGITVKAVYTPAVHQHTFSDEYSYNELTHWFGSTCGHDIASSLAMHTFGDGVVNGKVTEYTCTVCGYVKTVINTEDDSEKTLAAVINAAAEAIDNAAKGGDGDVAEYAAEIKADIEKLSTASDVNNKLAAALSEINRMKTEKAVAAALAQLDTVSADVVSVKAKSLIREAKDLINGAASPETVNAVLADALIKINAAEEAEKELNEAKEEAKAAIDEKAGAEQSTEMQKIVADAKAAIDAATSIEQVKTAEQLGLASVENKQAADDANADKALADAKAAAKAELEEAKQNAVSDGAKAAIDVAIANVDKATNTDAVASAKTEGMNNAINADKDLADAKEAAKAELEEAKKNAASDEAKAAIDSAIAEIDKATSQGDISTIKTTGITNAENADKNYDEKTKFDKTVIKVASAQTVDYRSIVTITATAENVPEGYILAIYVDGKKVAGDNNKSVTYSAGELKSDINYTVKVIDANGNVQKTSNGKELSAEGGKITCNKNFFIIIIAFFKGLFGKLPKAEVIPQIN